MKSIRNNILKYSKGLVLFAILHFSTVLTAQSDIWREHLDSVVIQANFEKLGPAAFQIRPVDLSRISSPMGTSDPVKYIQTLPGVSTGMEGLSAYYVRGGNFGNNMTTLDGVPVYGTGHLLGITTSYPWEIVDGCGFYMGGFPVELSGYTASILKLNSLDGDFLRPNYSVSINNFLTGIQASMPLKIDRLALLASVRFSPLGQEYKFLRPIISANLDIPSRIDTFIGDAFVKLSWKPSMSDDLSFSILWSKDYYSYSRSETLSRDMGWSNLIGNIIWGKKFVTGIHWNNQLSFNDFISFQEQISVPDQIITEATRMSIRSSVGEIMLRSELEGAIREGVDMIAGMEIKGALFAPGVSKSFLNGDLPTYSENKMLSWNGTFFGQMEYRKAPFYVRSAIKASAFKNEGYRTVKPGLDLFVSYDTGPVTLIATYDHVEQFYHTLEGIPTGWSMEMLVPATQKNGPESSDQVYLGIERSHSHLSFSAGGFYKYMSNLVFYSDASTFFSSSWGAWSSSIDSGEGQSFGLESQVLWDGDRFTGRMAYTLSKSDRVFPSQNAGEPIPFKFDRRNVLNLSAEYVFVKGDRMTWSMTSGVTYSSGHWESVSSGKYPVRFIGPEGGQITFDVEYYSHPNNLRLPAYFRWDASCHLTVNGRRNRHDLSFGIYNLTNRHNVYSLYWDSTEMTWKALSIFPIFPNMSYKIVFGK